MNHTILKHIRHAGIITLLMGVGLTTTAFAEPTFTKTSNNNCKVFNSDPEEDAVETVTWTGGCQNGFASGKGKLTWFVDGKKQAEFTGNFADGYETGKGTYKWEDGTRYVGDFVKGMMTGKGVFTWEDGSRYEGDFLNDVIEGYGKITYDDGTTYVGQWHDDQKSGKGVSVWKDGSRYEGNWFNDERNGKGVYTWKDGSRYEGYYADGEFNGLGKLTLLKKTSQESIDTWVEDNIGHYDGNKYIVEGMFSAGDLIYECDTSNPQACQNPR